MNTIDDDPILGFFDDYRWLSNFYPAVVTTDDDGLTYPTVEHAYQAQKTFDHEERKKLSSSAVIQLKAGEAKMRGSRLTLRPDWTEERRIRTMQILLEKKFSIPGLRKKLLATGDRYIEETNDLGNTFWGICDGKGRNVLGGLIMHIRSKIRAEEEALELHRLAEKALKDKPKKFS